MPNQESDPSLSETVDATCPLCASVFEANVWRIVSAEHRPDLLTRACDGSLQRSFCPGCVGPGVDHPGPFVVLRAEGAAPGYLMFLPRAARDHEAEAESLLAQMRWRASECGLALDSLEWLGTSLILEPSDVRDRIDDAWPDLKAGVDPTALSGPLPALLGAATPAERGAALRACRDLARPNVDRLLAHMVAEGKPRLASDALLARYFVSAARALGVDEAVRRDEAMRLRAARRESLPAPLLDRFDAFLERQPSPHDDMDLLTREARVLAEELESEDAAGLASDVWAQLGELARRHPGPAASAVLPVAVAAFGRALKSVEPDRSHQVWAILMGLSEAWHLRGDGERSAHIENALECASAAREHASTLTPDDQAEAAMEQGILYTNRIAGDLAANLVLAREALEFAVAEAVDARLRAMARYNLALADIEDPAEGRPLDRGIAMLQALARTPDALEAWFDEQQRQNLYQSLAVALARRATGRKDGKLDELDQAAAHMERALDIARGRHAPRDAALIAGLLARIETDRRVRGRGGRDLAQILTLIDQAGATLTAEAQPFEYARNELRRAGVLDDLAEPDSARAMIVQALQNACRVLTPDSAPDLCRRARSQLGELHFAAGEYAAAADAFATACRASEQVYADAESVSGREQEAATNATLYEGLVDALARLSELEPDPDGDIAWRVLEAMEAGRARMTLDLLGLRPLPPFAGVPEALREREARLIRGLGWTLGERAGTDDLGDADRIRLQRQRRLALEETWNEIEQCGAGGRRHAALRRSRPPRREAMAGYVARLGEGAAVASFHALRDGVLLAWLRPGRPPRIHPIALDAATLKDTWLAAFEHDVLGGASSPAHDWLALGEMLFAPVARELAELELLVLVPHRGLHSLPLHALSVRARPLIEQVPVLYGPSIGVLISLDRAEEAEPAPGPAFVASHATSAAEAASFEGEAEAIARQLRTSPVHHATRGAVLREAPAASVVHLACHGAFDADDPLSSGVLLADGVLRARDWLPLPLACDLVAFSACETGRQKVLAGDDLLGLGRTLLQAGARGVLLSLWRVWSDAASDWMTGFYRALENGSPALAFQQATCELRAGDPDPRAWAAFVLVGDSLSHRRHAGRSPKP